MFGGWAKGGTMRSPHASGKVTCVACGERAVIRMRTRAPEPENTRWRFSTMRFLGFVTFTCITLALGAAFPPLFMVWGLLWCVASIILLRLGTVRDTLALFAWGCIGAFLLALVWVILISSL
jgi:hypothetical protein